MELIGKIIGYIAIISSMLIYQQKNKKGLLICKGINDTLWICHYSLIGGYTGAAVTCVALIREIIFLKNNNLKHKKVILFCFLFAAAICTAVTWKNIFSLFALCGSLISVVSFWLGNPKTSRLLAFPISLCMLIYGVSNRSLAVFINEILVMFSSFTGILRIDRKDKNITTPYSY